MRQRFLVLQNSAEIAHVKFSHLGGVSISAMGLVSRAPSVRWCATCTGDEGRPLEVGNQVLTSSHRKLLSSKAMVVNVAETPGQGKVERGERKRTVDEVSKAD
jgi:hypothetical protein